MNYIEESKKLKESIHAYQAKIPKLEKDLNEAIRTQEGLDDKSLTAEILEERGWQKRKEEAEKNREEIYRLRDEIEKCKAAIEILTEKGKQIRPAILNEFKKKYRGECENDLKEFAKKLKEVAELEGKIIERRRGIRREFISVASNSAEMGPFEFPSTILPAFQPFLTSGPFTPKNKSLYRYFLEECKEQGINVG